MIKKFIQKRRQKHIISEIKKAISNCNNVVTLEELESRKPDDPMDVKILIPPIIG